jgi:hypothetical protein
MKTSVPTFNLLIYSLLTFLCVTVVPKYFVIFSKALMQEKSLLSDS